MNFLYDSLDQVGVTSRDVWERPGEGQEMEDEEAHLTQEQQEHKKKFKEWRKQHYDEFRKAKELLQQVSGCGSMTSLSCFPGAVV